MTAAVPVFCRTAFTRDQAAELAWMDRALCAEVDPDLHFPETGQPVTPAKAVCRARAVRVQCLEYVVRHPDLRGVWGGMSEQERRRLRQEAA